MSVGRVCVVCGGVVCPVWFLGGYSHNARPPVRVTLHQLRAAMAVAWHAVTLKYVGGMHSKAVCLVACLLRQD